MPRKPTSCLVRPSVTETCSGSMSDSGDTMGRYLSAEGDLPAGLHALRAIGGGELISRSSVGDRERVDTRVVSVLVDSVAANLAGPGILGRRLRQSAHRNGRSRGRPVLAGPERRLRASHGGCGPRGGQRPGRHLQSGADPGSLCRPPASKASSGHRSGRQITLVPVPGDRAGHRDDADPPHGGRPSPRGPTGGRARGGADIRVVRRCADTPELLSVAASGAADLALVSATFRGVDRDALRSLAVMGCARSASALPDDGSPNEVLRQLGSPTSWTPGLRRLNRPSLRSLGIGEGLASVGAGGAFSRATDPVDRPAPDLVGQAVLRPPGCDPSVSEQDSTRPRSQSHPRSRSDPAMTVRWGGWWPCGARPAPRPDDPRGEPGGPGRLGGQAGALIDADTWGGSIGKSSAWSMGRPASRRLPELSEQECSTCPGSRGCLLRWPRPACPDRPARPDRWHEVRRPPWRTSRRRHPIGAGRHRRLWLRDRGRRRVQLRYRRTPAQCHDAREPGRRGRTGRCRVRRSCGPAATRPAVQDVVEHADVTPRVVVSKTRRSACGPDPGAHHHRLLGRFAGLDVVHCLPWAPDETDRALWEGRSLSRSQATDERVTAIRAFAGGWLLTQESPPFDGDVVDVAEPSSCRSRPLSDTMAPCLTDSPRSMPPSW